MNGESSECKRLAREFQRRNPHNKAYWYCGSVYVEVPLLSRVRGITSHASLYRSVRAKTLADTARALHQLERWIRSDEVRTALEACNAAMHHLPGAE